MVEVIYFIVPKPKYLIMWDLNEWILSFNFFKSIEKKILEALFFRYYKINYILFNLD